MTSRAQRVNGRFRAAAGLAFCGIFLLLIQAHPVQACSTFKLQKGNALLYGHNLNQPGMDVPGQIFINKRGVFKIGRSLSEMVTKDGTNPSGLSWISRYGSVTFSTFGKDMPDGGLNEAGLYIWEMSSETEYPKNPALPKLSQMNWMQYVLDRFSTTDEVVASAHTIEIDGWGWHFFVGDTRGRCAAVEFIKGKVVVHSGEAMPIPALFNQPYTRELEIAAYYQGFGGLYPPSLDDKRVPRFVKTAAMIRDYDPAQDAVAYGLKMLERIKVNEVPDWTVLADVRAGIVYFKTALNPEIKTFSLAGFDFSNQAPAQVLTMDQKQGGDTAALFHAATEEEIRGFLAALPMKDSLYSELGTTKAEFTERFARHTRAAEDPARQFFKGTWAKYADPAKSPSRPPEIAVELKIAGNAVTGEIRNAGGEKYALDHLQLVQKSLSFTFRNLQGTLYIGKAALGEGKMDLELWGIDGLRNS